MVDGGMTPELMAQIQHWGSLQGYDNREDEKTVWVKAILPPLKVMNGIFETPEAVQGYLDTCKDSYFLAFRCREYAVSTVDYSACAAELSEAARIKHEFFDRVAPWNRASKTFTCKACGQLLRREDLRRRQTYHCPCGEIQLSATNKARLERMNARISALNKECLRLQRGEPTERTYWVVHCCFPENEF